VRLAPLESLLNRNLAASSAARALCQRLDTKVLALHVEGLPLSVYFKAQGESMTLHTEHQGTPDATLSGSPLSLLRLAGPAPEAALRGGSVHIEGDAEVAQTFSELLKAAQPDLEEELSRVVGDVAAHQIGNVAEYLQEEGRDVPNRTEAEEFLQGVDKVRDDVERLEARLSLLEKRQKK
jgi:ubiquinone biosynthesis protein UbiJ